MRKDGALFYIMLSQSLCQCHLINFTHTSKVFLCTTALCFDRDFGSTLYKMKMLKLQISPALTTKLSGLVSNPQDFVLILSIFLFVCSHSKFIYETILN